MTVSPDLLFWLALAIKMAVTAGFVVAATFAAERAGPLIGGLIATLPIAAGPAYVFLALDHDPQFIADSAVNSLVANPAIAIFATIYTLLARRRSLFVSLGAAMAVWIALVVAAQMRVWTLSEALLLHLAVMPVCLFIVHPLRHAAIPRVPAYRSDMFVRAAAVSVLVATVVTASFAVGPGFTGVLAVFPIVLSSVVTILHRRVGGPAASAVMANIVLGLVGFGCSLLTLHLTAVPLGSWIAMALALAVSFAWGLMVTAVRLLGARRA